MSATHERAASTGNCYMSLSYLTTCPVKRSDTLIASIVLVLLLAGWLMNFVGPRQLSEGVGNIIAHSFPRQA